MPTCIWHSQITGQIPTAKPISGWAMKPGTTAHLNVWLTWSTVDHSECDDSKVAFICHCLKRIGKDTSCPELKVGSINSPTSLETDAARLSV
jgi:hypothetical protein